jgi:hypothetical protein
VKKSKIDISCFYFSLHRPKDRLRSWSQNQSHIILAQFWHQNMMRLWFWLRFWLRLQLRPLSFGLNSENIENWYQIFDFFTRKAKGYVSEPEPKLEPHHIFVPNAVPTWKNDAAPALAPVRPLPMCLYCEKNKDLYKFFHYISPRIGVGARTWAASFFHVGTAFDDAAPVLAPVRPLSIGLYCEKIKDLYHFFHYISPRIGAGARTGAETQTHRDTLVETACHLCSGYGLGITYCCPIQLGGEISNYTGCLPPYSYCCKTSLHKPSQALISQRKLWIL